MNESPVPPFQPSQEPQNTYEQPTQQSEPRPTQPQESQAFANWSLGLGIGSLVLGIIFFLSIPAAIVAVILGSVSLFKHRPGKGKSIAGVITGGLTLLIIPILAAITIVAYNGISERANQLQSSDSQSVAMSGKMVETDCFTYKIPTSYKKSDSNKACNTSVNIPSGDALTRITVKANTGTIGSLKDVVAKFNATLKKSDPKSTGIIEQEQLTANGKTVYYISYKDANGLLFGNYITPVTTTLKDETGETITAYSVAGYTYNKDLKSLVRGVNSSLVIK